MNTNAAAGTDKFADRVTPKVNRRKGKDVKVGDLVVMSPKGAYGRVWAVVAEITRDDYMGAKGNYRFTSTEGHSTLKAGNEFIQLHS